jgi:hypothetical protein
MNGSGRWNCNVFAFSGQFEFREGGSDRECAAPKTTEVFKFLTIDVPMNDVPQRLAEVRRDIGM